MARVAADVGHIDADTFAVPGKIFGELGADFGAIDVAENAAGGFEGAQLIENFGWAEITRVPEFIAEGEVGEDGGIEKAVCVGEEADAHLYMVTRRYTGACLPRRSALPAARGPLP